MNIILGTDLFLPGISGVITAVRNLAENLRSGGHEVTVVCPDSEAARQWAFQNTISLLGVAGLTIPLRIQQRLGIVFPNAVRRIDEALRRADILHLHSPLWIGRVLARLARQNNVPVVVTNHALPENVICALRVPHVERAGWLARGIWRLIGSELRAADLVTAPTEFAARQLSHRFGKLSVHVISNGVKLPPNAQLIQIAEQHDQPMRALYVGRLQREKRVDELLYALKACLSADLLVELTIVGDGPDRRRLERLVRRIGISGCVSFTGIVTDQRRDELYARTHFLWIASSAELQCCAALEAMASSRPVIAVRSSALPETVPDGIAGRLYDEGDIKQLASIMAELRADPEAYRRLSCGAASVASRHQLADVRFAVEQAYELAIACKHQRAARSVA